MVGVNTCPLALPVLTSCASPHMTHTKRCTGCCSWPSVRAARALACSDCPPAICLALCFPEHPGACSSVLALTLTYTEHTRIISQKLLHAPQWLECLVACELEPSLAAPYTSPPQATWAWYAMGAARSVTRGGPCCWNFTWFLEDLHCGSCFSS